MKFLCVSPELQAFPSSSLQPFIDSCFTEDQQHKDVRCRSVQYISVLCASVSYDQGCVRCIDSDRMCWWAHIYMHLCAHKQPLHVIFYGCASSDLHMYTYSMWAGDLIFLINFYGHIWIIIRCELISMCPYISFVRVSGSNCAYVYICANQTHTPTPALKQVFTDHLFLPCWKTNVDSVYYG